MAGTSINMTSLQDLLRLMSWLSPAFPTGAFSYSHGLEAAVAHGKVANRDVLKHWLFDLVTKGSAWNDCILLTESWRRAREGLDLASLAELGETMAVSRERHLETLAQGKAFLTAAREWHGDVGIFTDAVPLPVAVGALAGWQGIPLDETLTAFLHAFVSNQVQVALRLMPLGQQNGLWVLRQLEDGILASSERAANCTLAHLGSAALMADIEAMNHETLDTRIFRS